MLLTQPEVQVVHAIAWTGRALNNRHCSDFLVALWSHTTHPCCLSPFMHRLQHSAGLSTVATMWCRISVELSLNETEVFE